MAWIRRTRRTTARGALAPLLLLALALTSCALLPPAQPTPTPLLLVAFREFRIPSPESQPTGITAGPDGAVWFTELSSGVHIGRISSAGSLTEFPNPIQAQGITAGPDGALWVTDIGGDAIGRITPAGAVTKFALHRPYSSPQDIAAGPDGALWFTEANVTAEPGVTRIDEIMRITPAGALSAFPLPTLVGPQGITAGPDGALWFTEAGGNQIGRITPAGALSAFALPTASSYPQRITTGPDGALWFTESGSNKIGRITRAGAIREFPMPHGGAPWGITAGPDGALWFTEGFGPVLGRLTVAGVFSNLSVSLPAYNGSGEAPVTPLNPRGITVGPDGALWFTEAGVNRVARVGFVPPTPIPAATATSVSAVPAGLTSLTAAGPAPAWRENKRGSLLATGG